MARKNSELIEVVNSDLRGLIFWAVIGIRKSRGGAFENEMANIIECYGNHIGYKPEKPVVFGADLGKMK